MAERTTADAEKTVSDILGDFTNHRIGDTAAKQVRDAADQSIEAQRKADAFHRAIKR